MLCPPCGTRLPPTKATSASAYSARQLSDCIQQKNSARKASPFHSDRRQKRIDICSSSAATAAKRSGRRGARIITARGCGTSTFSNAFSSRGSSPSTVLPQTRTGPASLALIDFRKLSTIAGGAGAGMSNFRFPLTCTRSALAPRSRSRAASSGVCARNKSTFASSLRSKPRKRRYRGHDRSEMRAFTTAIRAAAGMRQPHEIRPELSLRNHHQLRPQRPQVRTDRKGEIHREVKHIRLAKALAGQRLPSVGGRGNENPMPRKTPPQFLHQTRNRQHFANRNRVHPDRRLLFPGNRSREGTCPSRSARPLRYLPCRAIWKSQ